MHVTVAAESLQHAITTVAQRGGELLLHGLQSATGSVVGPVASAIIFLYVFISLLVNPAP